MRDNSGNDPNDPRFAPGQPPNGPVRAATSPIAAGAPSGRTATSTPVADKDKKPPEQKDAFREIVETVVFVVVLVLLLKAFMAEAFVIPTGSMATTLLGYHRDITCPQCGFRFPLNMSKWLDAQDPDRERITGCTCPNCFLHIDGSNSDEFKGP
jgi:signal peptidase I